MPERLTWQYSDQVLDELGFLDPDAEEDFYALLYRLAADPTDKSELVEPVPGFPDLMTVTFSQCVLMYQIGQYLTALQLRQLSGGSFNAGGGGGDPSRL